MSASATDVAMRSLLAAQQAIDDGDPELARDRIAEVMDQLTGFCSPRMKLAADSRSDPLTKETL